VKPKQADQDEAPPGAENPVGPFFSVCGQICGQGSDTPNEQAKMVKKSAVCQPFMEILIGENQRKPEGGRVRW